jgi:hypothetical protein
LRSSLRCERRSWKVIADIWSSRGLSVVVIRPGVWRAFEGFEPHGERPWLYVLSKSHFI